MPSSAAPHLPPRCLWVVEDDSAYRTTLESVLAAHARTGTVRAFACAEDALAAVRSAQEEPPSLVLLDVNLPGLSGVEALARLREACPQAAFLMLTMRDDAATVFAALRSGALGYLLKDASLDRLLAALDEIEAGGMTFSPPVARLVAAHFQSPRPGPDYGLTARETEVLRLMAEGMDKGQIAQALFLSRATVSTHVARLYDKLQVRTATGAVSRALRERLV